MRLYFNIIKEIVGESFTKRIIKYSYIVAPG